MINNDIENRSRSGRTRRVLTRVLAGAAGVAATATMLSIGPAPATADTRANCGSDSGGKNVTAKFGSNYVAKFCARGEMLHVSDGVTDGKAAYAYVRVLRPDPHSPDGWIHYDSDSFKVPWQASYGLDSPDSASGTPEGYPVGVQVCKGAKKKDESNCSKMVWGRA
ncbi:hypothetical protein [Microlunatus sp. GCM10028923]|uniref:hypothetical protein n=1 Tax=Microlunatus sp. GCM10028923 TaxID=3273400 RepID=UPI0036203E54